MGPRPAEGGGCPRPGRAEALLLGAALAVRVLWACLAPTDLWFDHVFNDATARSLALGHGFTASTAPPFDPAVFRTPGYPSFLAAVYLVAGPSVRAAFLAQALLDTLSCWLLWRMAARTLGPRTGLATLALAASYPFTVHAVGTLSPETPLVLLGLLLAAVVDSWPAAGGTARVLAAGVLCGALSWVKPVFLPLPLFLLLADRLRGRPWRTAVPRGAAAGAVALALFAPWVLRNQREFGRPLLSGETGIVVSHGTRDFDPSAPGEIRAGFEILRAEPAARYEKERAGYADSRALLAKDGEYLEDGLSRIRARPARAFLLDPLRRVPRLWISSSHALMPGWVGWAAAAASVLYLLLGAAGLWALRGSIRAFAAWWILPVALTLLYAALHAEARYTLPARPTLLLLGGAALAAWGPGRREEKAPGSGDAGP